MAFKDIKIKFCENFTNNKCNILDESCIQSEADSKKCDMLMYYKLLSSINDETPNICREIRENMLIPVINNWRGLIKEPSRGKKYMLSRPMENAIRDILIKELEPLGVISSNTGKKFEVWEGVYIVADALLIKNNYLTSILSFKTWLGEAPIRETFASAYFAKLRHGGKNIRVYMVGLQIIYDHLNPLITACKPYIDGVFSLCGKPYLDDLITELKQIYSQ